MILETEKLRLEARKQERPGFPASAEDRDSRACRPPYQMLPKGCPRGQGLGSGVCPGDVVDGCHKSSFHRVVKRRKGDRTVLIKEFHSQGIAAAEG